MLIDLPHTLEMIAAANLRNPASMKLFWALDPRLCVLQAHIQLDVASAFIAGLNCYDVPFVTLNISHLP